MKKAILPRESNSGPNQVAESLKRVNGTHSTERLRWASGRHSMPIT